MGKDISQFTLVNEKWMEEHVKTAEILGGVIVLFLSQVQILCITRTEINIKVWVEDTHEKISVSNLK